MKIAIAADHAGFALKEKLRQQLAIEGHEVLDFGPASGEPCDYPDFAQPVARDVAQGRSDRGILVCATGIGMAMAQVIANLFQRQTLLQEVRRAGMTQGVGAVVRQGGAHRTQAPRDDQVEGAAGHRAEGRVTGDEHLAERRWRPCLAQVAVGHFV